MVYYELMSPNKYFRPETIKNISKKERKMTENSKLQDYLRKFAAGELKNQEKCPIPMPELGKISTDREAVLQEIEKALNEFGKQDKSGLEDGTLEKESKYLLAIATRLPERTIPVHNGKATINVEVLPQLVQNLVSKGYLKEGPDGFVVTDKGLSMAKCKE